MRKLIRPDSDRLDYSEIIKPPYEYETAFAVGTTYSLDLETLIGIPIALGLSGGMDGQLKGSELNILEAIRKVASNIAVFCQSGKISVPVEKRHIFSLLENSIFQVLPREDYSFHPKLWVLKYTSVQYPKDPKYKLIVLSRNLTFDRSWDVAISIDGVASAETYEVNKPLSDFVNYLAGFVGEETKRKDIKAFAKELMKVEFKLEDRRFKEFSFHPIGIPGYIREGSKLFEDKYNTLGVISPFISKGSIEKLDELRGNSSPMLLISRKRELYKLSEDTIRQIECWHMKDCVIDGEDLLEEQETEVSKQDIHAKLYLKTVGSMSELWLGSANCSHKAFNGNVEFLFRLKGTKTNLNIETLRKDLFGEDEKSNPFERFKAERLTETEKENLNAAEADRLIREICRINAAARVCQSEEGSDEFKVDLSFNTLPQIPDNAKVELRPLLCTRQLKTLEQNIIFEGLRLIELGRFYVLKITFKDEDFKKEIVIKIDTEGIPDSRDSEIFKSIIKDKRGFMEYVAFLLGEDFILSSLEQALTKEGRGQKLFGHGFETPVLYEKMLKAAGRNPERLIEIKKVMDILGKYDEELVPEEFKKLYEVFDKTVQRAWRKRR